MEINFKPLSNTLDSRMNVFLMSDELKLSSILNEINAENNDVFSKILSKDNLFKGKLNSTSSSFALPRDGKIITFVGIGDVNKIARKQLNTIGASIATKLNGMKVDMASIYIEESIFQQKINIKDAALYIAEGLKLRNYKFNKYYVDKKKEHELSLKTINIIVNNSEEITQAFRKYNSIVNSVNFTRDLVSEPGNVLYPESFANRCLEMRDSGLIVKVLNENEMKSLGMGSLLAVGQGSANPPRMAVLEWWGDSNGEKVPPIAVIGKGVTFDTGGINLKSSTHIAEMKYDMTGAAVVAGLMKTLAEQKVPKNVVGLLGLVENMPSGSAQRPSDVVTSMSGQTIEVENTDAEGRMVLADVMWYAQTTYNCSTIIDLATLTGAIGVALGDEFAGLFSNNDELANDLLESGKEVNELLWRMPLSEHYDNRINSEIADIRNTGKFSGAGATTAAQFLQRFLINKSSTKWAHLDIAGVSWTSNGELTNGLKGATGFGIRLLEHYITKK